MGNNIDLEVNKEEERKKKKTVLLILCILTIIVALVGATFAYFSAGIDNSNNESITVGATTLEGVTYQASKTITLYDAMPGDHDETKFTITNPNSSAKVRYSLKFIADVNNFSKEDGLGQLLITVSGAGLEQPVVLDFTDSENIKDGIIVSNVELNALESDDYNLRLDFVELGTSQNSNIKKTFAGHIEIVQTIAVQ